MLSAEQEGWSESLNYGPDLSMLLFLSPLMMEHNYYDFHDAWYISLLL